MHGRWRSFAGMYMFQFIGHIQNEPDNHHDNDCIRCTGVFLSKNIIFNGVHDFILLIHWHVQLDVILSFQVEIYKKDCKKTWQRRGQETSYIPERNLTSIRDFIMVNSIFLCSNNDGERKFGIFSFISYLRF